MGDISKDINSSFKNDKVKALINIIYTANWINSLHTAYFKPYGISPQQFNILKILNGAGAPLKVQVIKERMVERSPNTTRLMDKLFAKELINRFACPEDRRVVHIEISKEGIKLIDEITKNLNEDPLEKLSDEEAKQLSDLLDKIR